MQKQSINKKFFDRFSTITKYVQKDNLKKKKNGNISNFYSHHKNKIEDQ